MTQELIGELYRRYMRGELTLDQAAQQIFALMHGRDEPSGLGVTTSGMDTADQERTFALFGRLKWLTLREALPGTDVPPLGAQEFLADLEELERKSDTE